MKRKSIDCFSIQEGGTCLTHVVVNLFSAETVIVST